MPRTGGEAPPAFNQMGWFPRKVLPACRGVRRLRRLTESTRNNRSFSLSVPTCGRSTSEAGVNGRPFVTSSRDQRGKLWPQLTPMRVHSYLHLARQRISDCIWLCSETLCRSASDSGPCSHAARLPPALDSCAGIDQFGAKYRVRQFVTGVKFDR
jgi:hypothetical protein